MRAWRHSQVYKAVAALQSHKSSSIPLGSFVQMQISQSCLTMFKPMPSSVSAFARAPVGSLSLSCSLVPVARPFPAHPNQPAYGL